MLRNNRGFASIETILMGGCTLALCSFFIALFIYLYPSIMILNDVNNLSKSVIRNGGITEQEIDKFKREINYPFVEKQDIVITAYTEPNGYDAVGVTEYNYVSKKSEEMIRVKVYVPANDPMKFFSKINDGYYVYEQLLPSEKY